MNEHIKQILNEMDPYMSECTMLEFLAGHRKMKSFVLVRRHIIEMIINTIGIVVGFNIL